MNAAPKLPKDGLALIGIGAAACAACCAGPVLGFLAVLGLGTVAGVALFGVGGLLLAVVGAAFVVRRRARPAVCHTGTSVPVEVGVKR